MGSLDVVHVYTFRGELLTWVIVTPIVVVVLILVLSGLSPGQVAWIDALIIALPLTVIIVYAIYSILRAWRGDRAVRRIMQLLSSGDLGKLGDLELYEVSLEGFYKRASIIISIGGRARSSRYEVKVNLKPLGRVTGSPINIRDLAKDNLAIMQSSGTGILKGKILKVSEGEGAYLIPLPATRIKASISESVGDPGDLALFKVDIDGCRVSGNVTSIVRRRARSYKVEVLVNAEGEWASVRSSLTLYHGGEGDFQAQIGLCRDTLLVVPIHALHPLTILHALEGRITAMGGSQLLAIGGRSDVVALKLSIDIPLSRDIVKEIPLGKIAYTSH